MDFPFGQPIVVEHRAASGRDGDGNTTWTVTTQTVTGAFAPGGSVERVQGQDVVVAQPTVYLPEGTAVAATDRVQVGGVTYEVSGSPNPWTNPFTGWAAGVEVKLVAVTG